MTFGIDARHLSARRGVARYTRAALLALAGAHPQVEWRCLVPGREPLDLTLPANVTLVRTAAPGRVVHGAAALTGRPRLDALLGGALEAVWIPAPAPLALSPGLPYVLTVHDLSWETAPARFTRYERLWHRLARPRELARGAGALTAVSTTTARALQDRWGIPGDRVLLAPPGVTPVTAAAGTPRRAPFFLFVGALEPRKGIDVLAQAWRAAISDGLDADLLVVGAGREEHHLEGLPRVVLAGRPDDPHLAALMRDALAVVAPSLDEGFGMVPLEAAAQRTPSIVTDLPAFRETLGDDALFVPPGGAAALAGALHAVVHEPERADTIATAARQRALRYTWEATATALWSALQRAGGA